MGAFTNSNRWGIILGGSSGLGLATAKKLAKEGMNLCIVHRDRKSDLPAFENSVTEMKAHGIQCLTFNKNALNQGDMEYILDEVKKAMGSGKISAFLHSIAKGNLKPMTTDDPNENLLGEDDFQITIHAMAVSYYNWIQAIYQKDMFDKNASCIGLSSEGNQKAWKHYSAVSAAKASLEAISRSVALEFGSKGIRSNIIQAGITETTSFKMIPGNELLKEYALKRNPNGRITQPENIANAIYLLCLSEASWINGTIIPVDGGESIA